MDSCRNGARCYGAGGPGTVLDYDGLAESSRESLPHHARDEISATAGWKADKDAYDQTFN